MYGINPKGTVQHNGVTVPTILCHQDSYKLKLGSNHSDMYDWFNLYGKTMDDVRNDVAALINGTDNNDGGSSTVRYFKIVDPTGMNMRTEPNKTLVQNIPQGAVISGTQFKTANNIQWLYTTYNGKSGYVAVLPESKGYAKEVTSEYNKPAAPTTDWETKYNTAAKELESANSQIKTLTTQVNDLTNANKTLNTQIAQANEKLAAANNQVGALTGQVNELNGKVNTLTSQVEKLDSEKNALAAEHSKCANNNQVIANLKKALNDLLK